MKQTLNNRYILEEKLGVGSTGTVYRATDRLTNETVALKRITTTGDDDSSTTNRAAIAFAREFQTLASLRHPHIINVKDYGFADKQPFFTMELLNNPLTILEAGRGSSDQRLVDLLIQVLEALAYLHRHNILHRDLKPTNVYVADGQVRLLDFGLSVPRTQAVGIVGTLAYMAPEVLAGGTATEASDLYAVGVIAYELLVGQHPYGASLKHLLLNLVTDEPVLVALDYDVETLILERNNQLDATKLPDLSDDVTTDTRLGNVVRKLLARDPAQRYHEAENVIRDLAQATNRPPPPESWAIRESFLQAPSFVGRDAEINLLQHALNQAQNGHGSAWLVSGESGVGRTRLLQELHSHALVKGLLVLDGRSTADTTTAFGLWHQPLRRLLLSLQISDMEAAILRVIIPDIDSLLGRPVSANINYDPHQLSNTIVSLFRRNPEPTILILDDLHWASKSLSVLKKLTAMVGECPLLIIGSYRDDIAPELPHQLPTMLTFKLDRLKTSDIAAISASILGEAGRRPEVVSFLQQQTDGNVFFLIEIIRALARQTTRLFEIGNMTLPDQVLAGGMQAVLAGRLAAVPDWAIGLLQLAAIAGREIDSTLLKHINTLQDHSFEEWLLVCADAAILEVHDNRWRFTHDKMREGILAQLPDTTTVVYHRQIGEALEVLYPNQLSHAGVQAAHWHAVGDRPREAHYSHLAGLQALHTNTLSQAQTYFERALELFDSNAKRERLEISLHLGKVLENTGQYAAAKLQYDLSLNLAKELADGLGQANALIQLGSIAEVMGQLNDARAHYEAGLSHYEAHTNLRGQSVTLCNLGNISKRQSEHKAAIAFYQQALVLSRQINDLHEESRTLSNLGDVYYRLGRFQQAIQHYEQALRLNRQVGERRGESVTLSNIGVVYQALGELDRSLAYQEQALNIKRELGDQQGISVVLGNMARVLREQVQLGKAIEYLVEAYAISQDIGSKSSDAVNLANMGNCYHDMGQINRAILAYQQALQLARELNDRRGESYLLGYLGKAYLDLKDSDKAQETLQQALSLARQVDDRHSEGWALSFLAELDDESLQDTIAIADDLHAPTLMSRGRRLLARSYLMQGRASEALAVATTARQLNVVQHNHRLEALCGIAQLLSQNAPAARTAFIHAINQADQLLNQTDDYVEAHLTRAIASMGLSYLSESDQQSFVQQVLDDLYERWTYPGLRAQSELLIHLFQA